MSEYNYSDTYLRKILTEAKTIVMVGVSLKEVRPSYFVARYLHQRGYRIVPINPGHAGETLFGRTVYASLADIPEDIGPIHMVDVFRRADQVPQIVQDAVDLLGPRGLQTIWMQIGVVSPEAAEIAEQNGLHVVMDHCPKIEHQRLFGELRKAGFATGIISSKLQ